MAGVIGAFVPGDIAQTTANFEAGKAPTPVSTINEPTTGVPPPITNVDDLFADVQSSTTIEDIRGREAQEKAARRAQAENIFNPQIARAEEVGVRREGSGAAQLGQNVGLGFSTAGLSFMNVLQEETQEAIDNVVSQKAAFISQGDIAAMQRADKAIQQLEDRKLKITLAKIDAGFKIVEQEMAWQSLSFEEQRVKIQEKEFEAGKERFNRTQKILDEQHIRQMSKEDRELVTQNIVLMANSGVPLADFSEEDITKFEQLNELPNGSFEAFYNDLLADRQRGIILEDLDIQQKKAEIARTWKASQGDKIPQDFTPDIERVAQGLLDLKENNQLSDQALDLAVNGLIDRHYNTVGMPDEDLTDLFDKTKDLVNRTIENKGVLDTTVETQAQGIIDSFSIPGAEFTGETSEERLAEAKKRGETQAALKEGKRQLAQRMAILVRQAFKDVQKVSTAKAFVSPADKKAFIRAEVMDKLVSEGFNPDEVDERLSKLKY